MNNTNKPQPTEALLGDIADCTNWNLHSEARRKIVSWIVDHYFNDPIGDLAENAWASLKVIDDIYYGTGGLTPELCRLREYAVRAVFILLEKVNPEAAAAFNKAL